MRDTGDNDPFSITIDFGHTFFINAEVFFDTLSPCVTVLEMENALHVSKRNRTSAERPPFTLQPPVRDRDREREGDGEKDRERESDTSSIHLDLFSPPPTPSTTATPTPNPTHTLASLSGAQSIQVNELRRLSFERAGFSDEGGQIPHVLASYFHNHIFLPFHLFIRLFCLLFFSKFCFIFLNFFSLFFSPFHLLSYLLFSLWYIATALTNCNSIMFPCVLSNLHMSSPLI